MGKLEKQLIAELSKPKPDKHYVKLIADAIHGGGITFKEFVESGRFMTTDTYSESKSTKNFSPDTTDVVVYLGGFIVEVRKPNIFSIKGFESTVLDKVELELWERCAKKDIGKLHDK